ncbi:hypothetical protein KKA27_01305 [Patescibacteria group bacterium]|nr:hypothetical protein [Patescibacteria group bacterium]
MGKNIKLALAVFSVFVLALLVFFQQAGQSEEKDKTDKTDTENSYSFTQREEAGEQERKEEKSSFMNLFELFKKDCQYAPDPEDNSEEQERVFISLEDLKKGFVGMPKTEEDAEIKIDEQESKLSDEEYFTLFYGEPYAEYVNSLQQIMLEEGYLNEDEVVDVKTEQDTYPIFTKFVDFMIYEGHVDEEIRQLARNGIKELIELNKFERPFMEREIIEREIMNKISAKSLPDTFLGKIIYFFVSAVQAVGEVTTPDCYRSSPPGQGCLKEIGFNGWAYCCNCGWKQEGYYRRWVADCSKENCDQSDGCLNSVCPRAAAIWDGFTSAGTGICGCACSGG